MCDSVQCTSWIWVDCDVSLLLSDRRGSHFVWLTAIGCRLLSVRALTAGEEARDGKTEEFCRKSSVNESQMAVRESGSMRIEKKSKKSREKMVHLIDVTITTCWWLHVGVSHEIGHNVLHYCHYNQLSKVEGRIDRMTGRRMIERQDDRMMKRGKWDREERKHPY